MTNEIELQYIFIIKQIINELKSRFLKINLNFSDVL